MDVDATPDEGRSSADKGGDGDTVSVAIFHSWSAGSGSDEQRGVWAGYLAELGDPYIALDAL